jgi:hypothetical protein
VWAELRCRADERHTSLHVFVTSGLALLAGVRRRVDHVVDLEVNG